MSQYFFKILKYTQHNTQFILYFLYSVFKWIIFQSELVVLAVIKAQNGLSM
jgi:hypothetical protein